MRTKDNGYKWLPRRRATSLVGWPAAATSAAGLLYIDLYRPNASYFVIADDLAEVGIRARAYNDCRNYYYRCGRLFIVCAIGTFIVDFSWEYYCSCAAQKTKIAARILDIDIRREHEPAVAKRILYTSTTTGGAIDDWKISDCRLMKDGFSTVNNITWKYDVGDISNTTYVHKKSTF